MSSKESAGRLRSFTLNSGLNSEEVPTVQEAHSSGSESSLPHSVSGSPTLLGRIFGRSRAPSEVPRGSPVPFLSMFSRSRASTAQDPLELPHPGLFHRKLTRDELCHESDEQFLKIYMSKFVPETSEQRISHSSQDTHYMEAVQSPEKFVNLLLRVANLDKILGSDGSPLISLKIIERVRKMMIPALVINAVKMRKGTYLLGLAQSACTSEWIKSSERTITQYARILDNPESPDEDVQFALPASSSFCLALAKVLLEGVDIVNWDNFKWPIQQNVLSQRSAEETAEAPAIKLIRNGNLKPLNIKDDETAQQRFKQCAKYLREHQKLYNAAGGRHTKKRRRRSLRKRHTPCRSQ